MWKSIVTVSVMAAIVIGLMLGGAGAQAQKAAAPTVKVEFDPTKFTCKQFVEMLSKKQSPEAAGMGILWMSGYVAGIAGYEKVGALTQKNFEAMVAFLVYFSQTKGEATLLEAMQAYAKVQQ